MYRAVKFFQMYKSDGTALTALHASHATFLDIISETDSAAELKKIATDMGLEFHKKSVKATGHNHTGRDTPITTRVIELVERHAAGWHGAETYPVYLAWLKVPDIEGLKVRAVVSDDVSDAEFEYASEQGLDYYELGIGQYGENERGECVIALYDHSFYVRGPLLGYTTTAVCALLGGTDDSVTFDDQVFFCSGCQTLQEDSDGYQYRYREVNGDTLGVDCGCAAAAELDNLDEYVNDHERSITSEAAETLVNDGKLVHVARYIGGMVDPGRGGYYDGERVANGQPEDIIKELLGNEPDASFVCSIDECGQFQVYWSVYRVVTTDAKSA